MEKVKKLLKEIMWDACKHMVSAAILSCFWAAASGLDDMDDHHGHKKSCKYQSVMHYHPVRYLVCSVLEPKK